MAPSEGAVYAYVVLDNRWGPAASGSKESCLSFIAAKLTEQSEQQALVNPSSYRLVKVRQL